MADQPNIEEQREKALRYCKALHEGIATLDAFGGWREELNEPDSVLIYSNNAPVKGTEGRDMLDKLFKQLDLCEHTISYVDYVPPRIYQAVRVRYRVKGDPPSDDIEVPGFVTYYVNEYDGGRLKAYRTETFVDSSKVFQRIAAKNNKSS